MTSSSNNISSGRLNYKLKGKRIKLLYTNDPFSALKPGATGVIEYTFYKYGKTCIRVSWNKPSCTNAAYLINTQTITRMNHTLLSLCLMSNSRESMSPCQRYRIKLKARLKLKAQYDDTPLLSSGTDCCSCADILSASFCFGV